MSTTDIPGADPYNTMKILLWTTILPILLAVVVLVTYNLSTNNLSPRTATTNEEEVEVIMLRPTAAVADTLRVQVRIELPVTTEHLLFLYQAILVCLLLLWIRHMCLLEKEAQNPQHPNVPRPTHL